MHPLPQEKSKADDRPMRLAHPTPYHQQQSMIRQMREMALDEGVDSEFLNQFFPPNPTGSLPTQVIINPTAEVLGTYPSSNIDYKPVPAEDQLYVDQGADFSYCESPSNEAFSPIESQTHTNSGNNSIPIPFTRRRPPQHISTASGSYGQFQPGSFGLELHTMSLPAHVGDFPVHSYESFQGDSYPGSPLSNIAEGKGEDENGVKTEDAEGILRQQQLLYERRRRRRESHNAVERRRRDNINEKIQELSSLLPEGFVETSRPNKGIILRRSVDYIRVLQQQLHQQASRNMELEARLRQYGEDANETIANSRGFAGPSSFDNFGQYGLQHPPE
ncbi:uncharacterized protein VTP21DRAFT_10063 [Calcarisporiella thermophila]|uniref:uncharacterized protein n=1 Tax=Calcarisporiella thermophila TaxID=911321 RepID=UPI00374231CA